MKKLILCVSVFLGTSLHGFVDPSHIQKQANSAAGQVSSAQAILANDYNQLVALVQSMENTLCGANVESGLAVGGTGAYTNCTGGATAAYLQWAQEYPQIINYWNGIIPNLTSEDDYSDATDACTTSYGGKTGFFPAINAQQNNLNIIQSAFTSIIGNIPNTVGGDIAQANTQIGAMLTVLGTLTTSIIGNGSTVNEIAQNQQSSSVALYGSDGTGNTSGSDYEFKQCYNATVNTYYCSPQPPASPCATQLQTLLTDFSNWTSATIALFEQLKIYEPTLQGSYNASPDADIMNTIGCYLPSACNPAITADDFVNMVANCNYIIPELNFDIPSAVTSFTNSLNAAYQLNTEYYSSSSNPPGKLNQINARLNSIVGQLKLIGSGMQSINNTTQPILTTLAADCKYDIKEYQQQMEIAGILIGIIVGIAAFELAGIIGGPALEGIIQILQMVPPVNNATFGALTQILTSFEVKQYDKPVPPTN